MLLFFIGFVAGIISGMGIGGGTLLIPALVFLAGTRQQIAQSINLIVFIPSAIVALVVHSRKHNIEKGLFFQLALTGCIGAVAGSFLAVKMNSDILKRIFGVFLFMVGIYEIGSRSRMESKTNGKEEKK